MFLNCASAEWKSINTSIHQSPSLFSPPYAEILNPETNNNVTTTSVIAEISPITKLSGLYPLAQQSFEM
jgi:hypothetical protein